jgi:hypothetical protein
MIGRPERDSGCAFIAVFKRLQGESPGHDSPLQKLAHCLWHTMGFSKGDAEEAAQLALNVLKPLLGDAMRWTK